jgi:hypothetical protein
MAIDDNDEDDDFDDIGDASDITNEQRALLASFESVCRD